MSQLARPPLQPFPWRSRLACLRRASRLTVTASFTAGRPVRRRLVGFARATTDFTLVALIEDLTVDRDFEGPPPIRRAAAPVAVVHHRGHSFGKSFTCTLESLFAHTTCVFVAPLLLPLRRGARKAPHPRRSGRAAPAGHRRHWPHRPARDGCLLRVRHAPTTRLAVPVRLSEPATSQPRMTRRLPFGRRRCQFGPDAQGAVLMALKQTDRPDPRSHLHAEALQAQLRKELGAFAARQ